MLNFRLLVAHAKPIARSSQHRCSSQLSTKLKENNHEKMQAWQIHSYGESSDLKLSNIKIPMITNPNDVLIKVRAASVNPIDVAMSRGYGATILNMMRKVKSLNNTCTWDMEFPLALGRDFSGTVVSKGHNVTENLILGEEVWGVVPPESQGCHAEYVVVNSNLVNPRPKNLSDIEAASILYAGLTAWSALWFTGGLCIRNNLPTQQNRRILVLGGSGGVGSIAVQLLKAWNLQVVATCNTDAIELVDKLGADFIIDYNQQSADDQITAAGPYDVILDCCNQGPDAVNSKGYSYRTYISLNSPVLRNVDQYGFIAGSAKNLADLIRYNVPLKEGLVSVRWGFFVPSRTGIEVIQNFVEKEKIRPVIERVYPFSELPEAYERVKQGHLRGKIIIDMNC